MARKISVEIVGDASSLSKAFRQAEDSGRSFGRSFARVAKVAAVGAAGIGAGLAFGLKKSVDSAIEHQNALAQTNAVLKSTGEAANVTAKDITGLADAIEKKTGVDDLAIQSGENLLLTFTGIRNEVGKGNDIFTQATKTIADMSVALGQDTKSSAIQLGKALNDPVRGVTALRRVGVSFTKQQQNQIKTLVASGKTLDAQKLILRELNKEFGGSAEAAGKTFAGQLNILKARLDDVAQRIGEKLLPLLSRGLEALTDIAPAVQRFATRFSDALGPAIKSIATFVTRTLIPVFRDDLIPIWEKRLLPIIKDIASIFRTSIQRIGAVINEHREELVDIWDKVSKAISAFWKIARPIVKLFFETVLPVAIGVAITAIDKLTDAIAGIIKLARVFGHAIAAIIKAPINAVIAVINAFKLPAIKSLKIKGISVTPAIPAIDPIPDIPKLAEGGIVTRRTLALLGERGPEAVVPLTGANASRPLEVVIKMDARTVARQTFPHILVLSQRENRRRSPNARGPGAGSALGTT